MYNNGNNNKKLIIKLLSIPIIILLIVGLVFFFIYKSKEIRDIDIRKENLYLLVGESYRVEYQIVPSKAENVDLLWITDNENIISLENEVITGKATGTANVWVSSKQKPEVKKKISVSVTTKRGRLIQRLKSEFGYRSIDNIHYISDTGYSFDFSNDLFILSEGDIKYRYYYKERYIIYEENSFGNSKIVFDVNNYSSSCSTDQEKWCDSNLEIVSSKMKIMVDMLETYLGRDTTVDEI